MARARSRKYTLHLQATVNGKIGPTTFHFRDAEGNTAHADKADVQSEKDRDRLVRKAARKLKVPEATLRKQVDAECNRFIDDAMKRQAAAAVDETPAAEEHLSGATLLVRLVQGTGAELFHSPDGTAFARVLVGDHREVWPLRGSGFRLWLKRLYYDSTTRSPGSQAVEDALGVLEGRARFDGPEYTVHIRVAEHGGRIYFDLGRPDWQAVEVTPRGWRLVSDPPVRFRRTNGTLPLPVPERGGSLTDLRRFLNLSGEDAWTLLVAWATATLRARGPFPLLVLNGEAGTCKTTLGRLLQGLIDPNGGGLRSEPKEARDLMIAARNAWLVAYDNLSALPQWLSDCLCRLATGGGFGTRQLYTDGEEILFNAKRPALLTSIEEVVTAGDALDRAVSLQLEHVPDEKRRTEEALDAEFAAALPHILGGLLDAVALGLGVLPSVHLDRFPRMADFARWGEAVTRGQGYPPGTFLAAYERNRAGINEVALDASPVVAPLRQFLGQHGGTWDGSWTDLLEELSKLAGETVARAREWPKKPHVLSGVLKRLAPNPRRAGIAADPYRDEGKGRARRVRLTVHTDAPDAPDAPSRPCSYGGRSREPGEEG
jgi:hypothetical protein